MWYIKVREFFTTRNINITNILFNIALVVLSNAIRHTKGIKGIRTGKKKMQPLLSAVRMTVYIKKYKAPVDKLLELITC